MQVVKEAKEKTGKSLYTEKYEFRYCTGSIEPEEDTDELKAAERRKDEPVK